MDLVTKHDNSEHQTSSFLYNKKDTGQYKNFYREYRHNGCRGILVLGHDLISACVLYLSVSIPISRLLSVHSAKSSHIGTAISMSSLQIRPSPPTFA